MHKTIPPYGTDLVEHCLNKYARQSDERVTQTTIVEAVYAARLAFLQNNPTGYLRKIRLGRAELAQVQLTAPTNLSSGIGMLNGVPIERVDADSFIEVIYERH